MPIYEYECEDCNNRYEKEVSYKELSQYKPTCPICLSENSRRVYFPIGIVFKGNGFYKTDNGKKNLNGKRKTNST